MYMKPNKADENVWRRAQTANQNLKQNAQTQEFHMTQLEATSQQ